VTGGSGNDTLTGSAGANRILGGSGNDRVAGGGGSDVLDGSDGDDTLTGGAAGDTLTGGRGADVFVFALASDSGVLKSDRIIDLSTRSDVIDLSAIGVGLRGDTITFSFIGIDGFVRGAGAQLRYEVAGGTTSILGDTDGDGSADLRILLTGNVTLTEDVFIL
jgi:serralysin